MSEDEQFNEVHFTMPEGATGYRIHRSYGGPQPWFARYVPRWLPARLKRAIWWVLWDQRSSERRRRRLRDATIRYTTHVEEEP